MLQRARAPAQFQAVRLAFGFQPRRDVRNAPEAHDVAPGEDAGAGRIERDGINWSAMSGKDAQFCSRPRVPQSRREEWPTFPAEDEPPVRRKPRGLQERGWRDSIQLQFAARRI